MSSSPELGLGADPTVHHCDDVEAPASGSHVVQQDITRESGDDAVTQLHRQTSSEKQLTDDIIVDNIFHNLDVQDIVNLRQVSTQWQKCSYQPAIWKRIIDRTRSNTLPPLPPTERYSLRNLTAVEAERLVTRAVSIPIQWDKKELTCLRRWEIEAPRIVLEIALLPGGQYLIASMMDRSRTRFSVEVFTSDFKYSMGFPVARLETKTQAFDLRAKYMTIHGRQGIAIAYVRRDYRRKHYAERFDVNSIPPDQDGPSRMLQYECVAAHVPLRSLELLYDDRCPIMDRRAYHTRALQEPRPFQVLTEIVSRSRISSPVVDEAVHDAPFLAVIKHPNRILYKNLDDGLGCTLECAPHPLYHGLPHTIMALCILPLQHQLLVVRRAGPNPTNNADTDDIDPPHGPFYFAELYDIDASIPPSTTTVRPAAARSGVHDSAGNYWRRVWLSDHGLGPALAHDRSVRAHHAAQAAAPQPVSIFVDPVFSHTVYYETLFPALVPLPHGGHSHGSGGAASSGTRHDARGADSTGKTARSAKHSNGQWTYTLSADTPLLAGIERLPAHIESLADVYELRVLPGSLRPLTVSIPRKCRRGRARAFEIRLLGAIWDERLVALARGADGGTNSDSNSNSNLGGGGVEESEGQGQDRSEAGADEEEEENDDPHPRGQFKLDVADLNDVSALAWDESIGRLCIGYAASRSTRIAVFDFAAGARGVRRDDSMETVVI